MRPDLFFSVHRFKKTRCPELESSRELEAELLKILLQA